MPQGSILSPVLFCVKINNIIKSVKDGSDCSLFVDDFGLYAVGKIYPALQRRLQLCVSEINKWADVNGFKFSSEKTECIHFHNFRRFFPDPEIFLGLNKIPAVKEAKFLGITFDQKLNFKSHLRKLKYSCQKSLDIIRVVAHTDWGADKHTLLHLYRSLVRSKLDYGSVVYGSARKSYLKTLDPIHHQGLRLCLGAFRTTPVHSLYAEANEPSLENRRSKLALNYYLGMASNKDNPAYDCVMNPLFYEKYLEHVNCIPSFGVRMLQLAEEADIDTGVIEDTSKFTEEAPWLLEVPRVMFDLTSYRKHETSPSQYIQVFLEMTADLDTHGTIYTDGSKTDEGVACAAVFPQQGKNCHVSLPNECSVYTAELYGLVLGLQIVESSAKGRYLIGSDSLSALEAIHSKNLSNPLLISFFARYNELNTAGYEVLLAWIPGHVGICGNEMADRLAREAVKNRPINMKVPYSDLKRKVSSYVFSTWEEDWLVEGLSGPAENKLHVIRPDLKVSIPSATKNRKEETVLCRLHVGHTYFTHSFLLKGEDPPMCIGCNAQWSVRHILLDCWDLYDVRRRHYTADNIKQLFRDVPPDKIFSFLREVHLFYCL